MIGVHGLTLLQEVVKDVVCHRDEPFEIVESRGSIPSIREKQMLEVEKHNLRLFIKVGVKALNSVHSMKICLPRVNLGSRLDTLANVLLFRLILQLVLILIKLADRKLACEKLRNLLQCLLIL